MRSVLAVVAHPDDDVLGAGALLFTIRRLGARVRVVFLAEGSTCRFDGPDIHSEAAMQACAERQACAREALKILGVDDFAFHDLPCGRLDQVPIIDMAKIVESEIGTFAPDVVLTHATIDIHNDHLRTHQAVAQATRPNARNFVPEVLTFETLTSSEWRFSVTFVPTIFVPVAREAMEAKVAAMAAYHSEVRDFPFPRSREGLYTLAMYRGMQIGSEYAEAFQPLRVIRPAAEMVR